MDSSQKVPNVSDIVRNTGILEFINQVLGIKDGVNEYVKYLKLEATWILTNLAYGNDSDLEIILSSEHNIIQHLKEILKSSTDLQLIDQTFLFLNNCMHTNKTIFLKVNRHIDLIETCVRITEMFYKNMKINL